MAFTMAQYVAMTLALKAFIHINEQRVNMKPQQSFLEMTLIEFTKFCDKNYSYLNIEEWIPTNLINQHSYV